MQRGLATRGTRRGLAREESGTPIQNNLGELFAIVQFVKPFILNSRKRFKSIFEEPINIALSNDATESEIKKGKQRMALLYRELEPFMHRRTSHLLQRQLPPKHEMVIYVKQSRAQADLYTLEFRIKDLYDICNQYENIARILAQ